MAPKQSKPMRTQPDDNPVRVDAERDSNLNTSVVMVRTDQVILDPDHELAVQIPEGVGAVHTDKVTGIEHDWKEARTVEAVFDAGDAPEATSPDNSKS